MGVELTVEELMADARPQVTGDVRLRAMVVVIPLRVTAAAIQRQAAMVADLRTAAGADHTAADAAVDMGGKASLDSCPSVAT